MAGAKNNWSDSILNARVAVGSVVETGSACHVELSCPLNRSKTDLPCV